MTDPAIPAAIAAEARDWVMRLAHDPDVAAACTRWRARHPLHERAFREAERVWRLAPDLADIVDDQWRAEMLRLAPETGGQAGQPPVRSRRRIVGIAVPVALAAGLAALLVLSRLQPQPDLVARTPVAQMRVVTLADGSRVTLGADSSLAVRFDDSRRRVDLLAGQAFFEVAANPRRPFVVVGGDAEITVTGTKFDVNMHGADVRVAVLEGRVELRRRPLLPLPGHRAAERVLQAGETSELVAGDRFTPETSAPTTPGDWRHGRLYFAEAPLADVLADLQRYSAVPIRLESPAIGRLLVTASFRPDETDATLADLVSSLPIAMVRDPDGGITLVAAPPAG